MSVIRSACRPNREIAAHLLGGMRRASAEASLRRMRDMCRDHGIPYTESVEILGILSPNAEADIRRAIARTWGCSTLKVLFNSPGGLASVGGRLAEDLRELADHDVRIESFAGRSCSSAAILPFVVGHERSASPRAHFTLHKRALTAEGVGRLTPARMRKLAAEFDGRDDRDLEAFRSQGVILPAEWAAAFKRGEDITLSADSACKIGLVHFLVGK